MIVRVRIGTADTLIYVPVNQTVAGTTELAAASTLNRHKVIGAMLVMSATGTLRFTDGVNDLTGPADVVANGGFVMPPLSRTTGKDGKSYPASKPKEEPKPAPKPKSGKPRFDEKKFDKVFGPLVRLVNERGNAMGKGPNFQRCHHLLNQFMDAYKAWKGETA